MTRIRIKKNKKVYKLDSLFFVENIAITTTRKIVKNKKQKKKNKHLIRIKN
jgi:hypothetical protein